MPSLPPPSTSCANTLVQSNNATEPYPHELRVQPAGAGRVREEVGAVGVVGGDLRLEVGGRQQREDRKRKLGRLPGPETAVLGC